MGLFEKQTNKRPQKFVLADSAKVREKFQPGKIFTLGKDTHQRRIMPTKEANKGWLNVEVLWGTTWVSGKVSHTTLEHYLFKNRVHFATA